MPRAAVKSPATFVARHPSAILKGVAGSDTPGQAVGRLVLFPPVALVVVETVDVVIDCVGALVGRGVELGVDVGRMLSDTHASN